MKHLRKEIIKEGVTFKLQVNVEHYSEMLKLTKGGEFRVIAEYLDEKGNGYFEVVATFPYTKPEMLGEDRMYFIGQKEAEKRAYEYVSVQLRAKLINITREVTS